MDSPEVLPVKMVYETITNDLGKKRKIALDQTTNRQVGNLPDLLNAKVVERKSFRGKSFYRDMNNKEYKAITGMLSNRYDNHSYPPYIVYFTKVNSRRVVFCNNVIRTIKNRQTDHCKADLFNGVILMEFANYRSANAVLDNKELRQLGWIAFIPTLKMYHTFIINNVDKRISSQDVVDILRRNYSFKIVSLERITESQSLIEKKSIEVQEKPTEMIKVIVKNSTIPNTITINGTNCYVKRYVPLIDECSYCEKYKRVNEDCKAIWTEMWKSQNKSNFTTEFECPICENAVKVNKELFQRGKIEETEINDIKKALNISRIEAEKVHQRFQEVEQIIEFKRLNDIYAEETEKNEMLRIAKKIVTMINSCINGKFNVVELNDVSVNSRLNQLDQTSLHLAILNGAPLEFIRHLINLGADINKEDIFSQSPLYLAVTNGNDEILDTFANINYTQKADSALQFEQTCKPNRILIELLLKNGANVSPAKPKAKSVQSMNNEFLEDAFQNVKCCDYEEYSPITLLHLVTFMKDHHVLELLLKYGANVNSWHSLFGSPMFVAVFFGHEKIVKTLLRYGADVFRPLEADAAVESSQNFQFMSVLHLAINQHHEEIVRILVEHMTKNPPDNLNGEHLIYQFIKYPITNNTSLSNEFRQKVKFEKLYTKYGPPKTVTWKTWYEPDKEYSLCDYVMCMFLKSGIDVNFKNKNGMSILEIAASKGLDDPYVNLLLEYGADINARNCDGGTALHVALKNKDLPKKENWNINRILKYNPDFYIKDNNGRTPLSYVNDQLYKCLIRNTKEGKAALFKALDNGIQRLSDYYTDDVLSTIIMEIDLMKKLPVTRNPYCSLYNFLKLPRNKLQSVLRNQYVVYNYRTIDKCGFNFFYGMLREKFREAEIVNELECKFIKAMNRLLQNEFPEFVGSEIFKYLTLDEVRCVITASILVK